MNGVCLHIEGESLLNGQKYVYRAHIQLDDEHTATSESVESVFVELDYDRMSPVVNHRLHAMGDDERGRDIFQPLVTEALNTYNMKRFRGEAIDGEPRHN